MAINKNGVDDEAVVQAIANALEEFYGILIKKIDEIDILQIMARKNPYLYRMKAMQSASEIVESVLSAFVSSSEETIFGNCFFEPLAIAASGGYKALAEGIDVMVEDREQRIIYAIAVKSGTAVFNSDSKKKQEQNFNAGMKLAQQAHAQYRPIIGYGYGRKRQARGGRPKIYQELAGQVFWEALTGDPDFYLKILEYMGTLPEQYVDEYKASYARASNRLVRQFSNRFCLEDGSIDWRQLIEYNSGK